MVCARRLFCLRCAILPQSPVSGYKGDLYLPKESDRARFAPVQTGLQFSPIAPMPDVQPQPQPADK